MRPNIVIFNPDQWRGDTLGHVGNPAAVTPNLDRIVSEDAVSFRWAFCQNTVCTPSRCSFMSGWYPHTRGHRTMHYMMHEDEPVLLKTLKDNGYFVWWGGKNDLVPGQDPSIFDHYCDVKYSPDGPFPKGSHQVLGDKLASGDTSAYSFYIGKTEPSPGLDHVRDGEWACVEGAVDVIRGKRPEDQPFCIYLPLGAPHPPYHVEDPFYSMIDRDRVPPRVPTPENWEKLPSLLKGIHDGQGLEHWTHEQWQQLRATYYGMCTRSDHEFGMVVDALKDAGLYDNTAIFFFSDHGDFTGDYGLVEKTQNTFQDCLGRVPLVVKPPKDVPCTPRVSEALVELNDFPATVEALTGIEPKDTKFGKSLLPVRSGETDDHRDAVFCEGGRLKGEVQASEMESLEKPNSLYYPRIKHQVKLDAPHHTKAIMCRTHRWKYVRRLYETDELYDLHADPGETINRIDDPVCREVLVQLKDRLLTHYQETADVVPRQTDAR